MGWFSDEVTSLGGRGLGGHIEVIPTIVTQKKSHPIKNSLRPCTLRPGSTAAVAVAAAGVCGCGWLRFLVVLRDLYDCFCG